MRFSRSILARLYPYAVARPWPFDDDPVSSYAQVPLCLRAITNL